MEFWAYVLICVGIFAFAIWLRDTTKTKTAKEKRSDRRIYIIGYSIAGCFIAGLFWVLIQGGCHWTSTEWWCI